MFMDSAAFSEGEDVFSGLNRRGTFMMKRRAIRRSNACMASLVRLRGGMAGGTLVRAMCNSTDAFEKIKQFLSVSAGRQRKDAGKGTASGRRAADDKRPRRVVRKRQRISRHPARRAPQERGAKRCLSS